MAFTDSFNRADENLEANANWTRVGGAAGAVAIVSNQLSFASTTQTAYLCPDQGTANHYTQIVRRLTASKGYFECCARLTDINNFLGARYNTGAYELWKRVAGTLTRLGLFTVTAVVGDVIRLECVGDQISVKINGVLRIGPVTETAHQAITRQGLVARIDTSGAAGADDFEAGAMFLPAWAGRSTVTVQAGGAA